MEALDLNGRRVVRALRDFSIIVPGLLNYVQGDTMVVISEDNASFLTCQLIVNGVLRTGSVRRHNVEFIDHNGPIRSTESEPGLRTSSKLKLSSRNQKPCPFNDDTLLKIVAWVTEMAKSVESLIARASLLLAELQCSSSHNVAIAATEAIAQFGDLEIFFYDLQGLQTLKAKISLNSMQERPTST